MRKKVRAIPLLITLAALLGGGALTFWVILPRYHEVAQLFSSREALQQFVQGFGLWAPLVFFLLQAIQVIVSPIPGSVVTLAGGALFGLVPGFLLSSAGVIAGSLVAFYLARLLGQRFVIKLVGRNQFDKYNGIFSGKITLGLLVMFLVPFFPDDVLCLLAGLSAMRGRVFLLLLLVGRLPGTALATLIGGGTLSFSWWQWLIIGVVSLALIGFFFKYGDALGDWLRQKLLRTTRQEPGEGPRPQPPDEVSQPEASGPVRSAPAEREQQEGRR